MKKLLSVILAAALLLSTVGAALAEEIAYDENAAVSVVGSEPNVLDVVRFSGIADRTVFYSVLEALTVVQDGVVTGAGAESWEVAPDGLTYTFHLRENYWSDGVRVTAADYAEPLIRSASPDSGFNFASDIYCIENYEALFTGESDDIDSLGVEVVDDDTLVLHLSEASPALLSTFDFFPERADYVEKYGEQLGTEAESVIGNGPYTLESWVHNSELTFGKNEYYWNAENIRLSGYSFEVITNEESQYSALQTGEIDYLSVSTQEAIDFLSLIPGLVSEPVQSARTTLFVFNGADELFQNEKVRLAFSLTVDREAIAAELRQGLASPAYGLIPDACGVGSYNYREAVGNPLAVFADTDPVELLKEGLTELGKNADPASVTVTLSLGDTSAAGKNTGEYFQQMWQQALGVTVALDFNDSTTHLANSRSGDYQIAQVSWGANFEPQFQLSRWVGGGQAQVGDSEFDALVNQASATIDDAERLALFGQAETLLIQKALIAPIYVGSSVRFAYDYVGGLTTNPFDSTGFRSVYTSGK